MILKCIRTVAIAALAFVSVNVSGQDLLARQAPIDRKLKAVDSLALIRQIKAEQAVYPAYSLYPNWNNQRVHAYGNTVQIPDSFRIDLTGFCMPTTHTKITSKCGPRWRRMHNGLDIKVYIGDTIRAAFDGKVRMVKYERRGYGKYVVIRHDNGLETIYGHLSKQIVKEDEYVRLVIISDWVVIPDVLLVHTCISKLVSWVRLSIRNLCSISRNRILWPTVICSFAERTVTNISVHVL